MIDDVPPDSQLKSIVRHPFKNGAIEIGRFKSEGTIITVMRKEGGEWFYPSADALLRIHYVSKDSDIDQAWSSLRAYLRGGKVNEMKNIKVSENWSCILTYEELKNRSEFVFKFKGGLWEGQPILKLREPIEGMDLIQIAYDYHGIVNGSSGRFSEFDGPHILDSSKDIDLFIYEHLESECATVNGEWNPYKPTPL